MVHYHQKCNIRHISYCYVYDEKYPGVSSTHRLYSVNSYKTSGQSIHNVWDISEQITFELTWEMKVSDKSIHTCLVGYNYNVRIYGVKLSVWADHWNRFGWRFVFTKYLIITSSLLSYISIIFRNIIFSCRYPLSLNSNNSKYTCKISINHYH